MNSEKAKFKELLQEARYPDEDLIKSFQDAFRDDFRTLQDMGKGASAFPDASSSGQCGVSMECRRPVPSVPQRLPGTDVLPAATLP